MVILAISQAEQTGTWAGMGKDFLEQGGDVFFSKLEIDRKSRNPKRLYAEMGEEIANAFVKKGWVAGAAATVELQFDHHDYLLGAELDSVGLLTFKRLFKGLAPHCTSLRIDYVSPGMSGARVFKLVGYTGEDFSGGRHHLFIKVSKDALALAREVESVPKPGKLRQGVAPEPLLDKPVQVEGWSAIGYGLLRDARPLESWLLEGKPDTSEIEVFLERLFKELAELYRLFKVEQTKSALDLLFLPTVSGARAMLSLQELWPLLQRYVTTDQPDGKTVEDFIRHRRIGSREDKTVLRGTLVCDSHGDLHGRNILVGLEDGQPHLVDFSERADKQWAFDAARLSADLFIRGWDYGVESYDPHNLEKWRQTLERWLLSDNGGAAAEDDNSGIWTCLVWIRSNLKNIWGGMHPFGAPFWQFQLAVAVEFLRLAGETAISAPKRALALISAHDVLVELETSIPTGT